MLPFLLHLRRARRRPHDAAAAAVAMLRLHQDRPPPAAAAAAPDQGKAVVARNVLGGHRPHVPRRVGDQLMELVVLLVVVVVVRGGGGGRGRAPRSGQSARTRVGPTA